MRMMVASICLALLTATPQAFSAQGDNDELQGLIDQLKQLTVKARQQRAADRWLLNDMEELIDRYDWPWRTELLLEEFTDGDYQNDPQWQVISGQFWVDGRLGLRSRSQKATNTQQAAPPQRQQKQDFGRALLGALLQEALRDDSRPPPSQQFRQSTEIEFEPAEIQLQTTIPLVFASKIEFSVHNRPAEEGRLEFAIIQDQRARNGYRIVLDLGQRPSLELHSMLNGRTRVINGVSIDNISDGLSHTLEWRREASGQIEILLDDKSLFQTRDRSFRYPFKHLAITNQGGDFAVSSISLYGE